MEVDEGYEGVREEPKDEEVEDEELELEEPPAEGEELQPDIAAQGDQACHRITYSYACLMQLYGVPHVVVHCICFTKNTVPK